MNFESIILSKLGDSINNNYVLLDLPFHVNIGDLLIWQGELNFLKKYVSAKMLGYYNISTFPFPQFPKETVILFHGGGNFGDVWRTSQEHRLSVIEKYPDNKIIILPQSVYYSSDDLAIKDAEIFGRHKNVTICVRDKISFDYIKKHFSNEVLLLPDMAFCIDTSLFDKYKLKASKENLLIKRTDHEYNQDADFPKVGFEVSDWPGTEHVSIVVKFLYLLMLFIKANRTKGFILHYLSLFLGTIVNKIFMHIIRPLYIIRGIRYISQYQNVYSTRLHGVILSFLLNRKVYIIKNNNGKLENYYHTWLENISEIKLL